MAILIPELDKGQRRYVIVVTAKDQDFEQDASEHLRRFIAKAGGNFSVDACMQLQRPSWDSILRSIVVDESMTPEEHEEEERRQEARRRADYSGDYAQVGDTVEWWCEPLAERMRDYRPDRRKKARPIQERGEHWPWPDELPPCPGGVWHDGTVTQRLGEG